VQLSEEVLCVEAVEEIIDVICFILLILPQNRLQSALKRQDLEIDRLKKVTNFIIAQRE
jgi:hypothetical protein